MVVLRSPFSDMPAVLASSATLAKRQYYYGSCPSGYTQSGDYCYSPWLLYGRWILLAGVVVLAFLLFCVFSRRRARRRQLGMGPRIAVTGGPQGYPQYGQNGGYGGYNNYGGPQNTWQQPPPQYSAPADGSHYGKRENAAAAPGPYGGQQSGSVELQQPSQAYQGGSRDAESGYAPPAGPPPGKTDGIIR